MIEEAREKIKRAMKELKRGLLSIEDAEARADKAIEEAVAGIEDTDEMIEAIRKLKRFKWNRLIEATRAR